MIRSVSLGPVRAALALTLVPLVLPAQSAPGPASVGARVVTRAPLLPRTVLATVNGVDVYQGGFGSSLAADPRKPGQFYLLTDRGPNVDLPDANQKGFMVPDYNPAIGLFRLEQSELRQVSIIELHGLNGERLTGRPVPPGPGSTGETPIGLADGQPLALDPNGLDTEGLVALKDGGFWVSDEYGPFIMHFDSHGRMLEQLAPFGGGAHPLPAVLQARRPNRGMEGLTLLPDQRTLVGLVQSPLDNPKAAGRQSRAVRLLTVDTRSGFTHQYVYLLEDAGDRTSEITALTSTGFLVLENDGRMPGAAEKPSACVRVYRIDIAGATDVSDPANDLRGRLFDGKTLEELPPADLAAAGVTPVQKSLLVDLLAPEIAYPHDKPEGIAVVDDSTLAISNDDDFGVLTDGKGGAEPKLLGAGQPDVNEVFIVRLAQPLGVKR